MVITGDAHPRRQDLLSWHGLLEPLPQQCLETQQSLLHLIWRPWLMCNCLPRTARQGQIRPCRLLTCSLCLLTDGLYEWNRFIGVRKLLHWLLRIAGICILPPEMLILDCSARV